MEKGKKKNLEMQLVLKALLVGGGGGGGDTFGTSYFNFGTLLLSCLDLACNMFLIYLLAYPDLLFHSHLLVWNNIGLHLKFTL
ncbi:hypothetical protein ACJX0J_027898, partial [Zea mays]